MICLVPMPTTTLFPAEPAFTLLYFSPFVLSSNTAWAWSLMAAYICMYITPVCDLQFCWSTTNPLSWLDVLKWGTYIHSQDNSYATTYYMYCCWDLKLQTQFSINLIICIKYKITFMSLKYVCISNVVNVDSLKI